jgi:integrase
MPLTGDEFVKVLTACDTLQLKAEGSVAKCNAQRLRTLVLLTRYSGMRASDAVTLTTDRLDGKKLFPYTQKTGTPVYTVLPESVLQALEATPPVTTKHYFWSGRCKRESIAGLWEKRLKKPFDSAEVSRGQGNAISHRFRDTFAVKSPACRSADREGGDSARPPKRSRHRTALQPMGTLATGAA